MHKLPTVILGDMAIEEMSVQRLRVGHWLVVVFAELDSIPHQDSIS
jgi:hypothetical protein